MSCRGLHLTVVVDAQPERRRRHRRQENVGRATRAREVGRRRQNVEIEVDAKSFWNDAAGGIQNGSDSNTRVALD